MPRFLCAIVSLVALAAASCSVFAPSGGGGGGGGPVPSTVVATGCAAGPKAIAPHGYFVNGNTICTADGQPHRLHGLDRDTLEFAANGQNLSAADFIRMASWQANVVRVALNQDYWLSQSPLYSPTYTALVDQTINWAESAGMDVILDLHWSDAGVLGSCTSSCQRQMADVNSQTFWSEVAARYKNDGRVLFELYNEPNNITWSVWKSGGASGTYMNNPSFKAVGMQQLYETVRNAGADNLVVIGGLNFAYDLSGVPSNRISGYNIVYATHPYNSSDKQPQTWDTSWGFLTQTDPVILTEFGDGTTGTSPACPTAYSSELIAYADAHDANWTAWAWYPSAPGGNCSFPPLVTDWCGTPNAPGMVVKNALAGYNDPAASGATAYTFGDGSVHRTDACASLLDAGTPPPAIDAGTPPPATDAGTPPPADAGTPPDDASAGGQ